MLWQPFFTLLTKESKDLCFFVDKSIAQPMQCTASSDILNKTTVNVFKFTRSLALMKDSFGGSMGVTELKLIL